MSASESLSGTATDEAAAEAADRIGATQIDLVNIEGMRSGRQHGPSSFALVDLVAGTGFEPVTSGL